MADKKVVAKKPTAEKKPKRATEARDATKARRGQKPGPSTRTAPVKRAVARPVKRAVPVAEKPREERAAPAASAPKPKAEPRPLPTAPAGHAPVIAADGSVSGSLELPAALAEAKRRVGVLFLALEVAAGNAHLGTAATKSRSQVAGGGAKPWRQKGTGRARQGSTRAPHWRHGGVVFGPNSRRYRRRIPEKMRREAFAEAFAARAANGRVLVYEGLEMPEGPRTKTVVEWLGKIGDVGKALLVTPDVDETTARAAANVQGVAARSVGTLRTTDVLTHDTLIVRRDALDALASRVRLNGGGA